MLSLILTKKLTQNLALIIHKANNISNLCNFNANQNEWHSIFDLISNGVTFKLKLINLYLYCYNFVNYFYLKNLQTRL
jgi:hypothetical protein